MRRFFNGFLAVFLTILPLAGLFAQQNVSAPQKFALVIGNGNYTSFGSLPNAVNDANDMTAALQGLGFTVDKVLDGNRAQMVEGITRLKNRLSVTKNSYGFFFYAGHGVQHNGMNYLIPAKADVPNANYLGDAAISVQAMLAELNDAGNDLNVVVLDACRDFPAAWTRSVNRGLNVVSNQPADSIIVFSTSAGSTAADGTGRNGLFTGELLKNLKTPGLEVTEVFRRTGADVSQASSRKQIPAIYNQFFGTAYLGSRPAADSPTTTTTAQTTVQPAARTETPAPANMVLIQGGTFTMGSPASEPERDNREVQHQVTVSSFYMGKYEVTQKEYQEVMGANPSVFKGLNLPVENVNWYNAVEYCNRLSQREGLRPAYTIDKTRSDPNNKSEHDTVRWLVTWNKNANGYRLPTEAEWEYACRAGTTTPFNTGNNITTGNANYNGNFPYNGNAKGAYREKTTQVGSFAPNPWGLYDMHGNVSEWCWDWSESGVYANAAQTDPAGEVSGTVRIIRGGAWTNSAGLVRSAVRSGYTPSSFMKSISIGFRLVRNSR